MLPSENSQPEQDDFSFWASVLTAVKALVRAPPRLSQEAWLEVGELSIRKTGC